MVRHTLRHSTGQLMVAHAAARMASGSRGFAAKVRVLQPGADAHPQLVDLHAVGGGIVPPQNHAGKVDQLFVIKGIGALLDGRAGMLADEHGGLRCWSMLSGGRARWLAEAACCR